MKTLKALVVVCILTSCCATQTLSPAKRTAPPTEKPQEKPKNNIYTDIAIIVLSSIFRAFIK